MATYRNFGLRLLASISSLYAVLSERINDYDDNDDAIREYNINYTPCLEKITQTIFTTTQTTTDQSTSKLANTFVYQILLNDRRRFTTLLQNCVWRSSIFCCCASSVKQFTTRNCESLGTFKKHIKLHLFRLDII